VGGLPVLVRRLSCSRCTRLCRLLHMRQCMGWLV